MQKVMNISAGSLSSCRVQKSHSFAPAIAPPRNARFQRLVVKAESTENDDDFEARIAALKRAKGETPYGEGKKAGEKPAAPSKTASKSTSRKSYDYTNETLFFESAPHAGDVAVNVALGITLIWLPLSIASISRGVFVKYRFTDRRFSTITSAPWKNEQLDAAYQEVKDVVCIGRGIGIWGDMVVTLIDGSKIEMRALPRFREMKDYILQRRDELTGGKGGAKAAAVSEDAGKGFSA